MDVKTIKSPTASETKMKLSGLIETINGAGKGIVIVQNSQPALSW